MPEGHGLPDPTPGLEKKPNPGSDAAQKMGCNCAVLDNNHGKFAPWPPDGWWIREGCPIHGLPATLAAAAEGLEEME